MIYRNWEDSIWVVQDSHISTKSLTVHFTKNQWHLFKFTSQLKFPNHKMSDQPHANRSTSSKCFYDRHKPCFHFYRCTECIGLWHLRLVALCPLKNERICLVHKPKSVLHVANTMALYVMTVIYCARRDNISLVNNTLEKMDHSLSPWCWPQSKAKTVRAFHAKQLQFE